MKSSDVSSWTYYPNDLTYYDGASGMSDLTVFWACFGGAIGLALLIYGIVWGRNKYKDYKREQYWKNRPINHEEQEILKMKMRKMKRLRLEGKNHEEIA